MAEVRRLETPEAVAAAAAEHAAQTLKAAIEKSGQAVWVLAGGTSPMLAYRQLIEHAADVLDWSKVTVLIGDERLVPLDHPDSNWGTIVALLESSPGLRQVQRLVPSIESSAERAAERYEAAIRQADAAGFDLVWIGVGEDGHTLSLFPGNPAFTEPTNGLVIPVHDSPKPPADRFSLSLPALAKTQHLVIFAVGAAKADALKQARANKALPVARAASVVEKAGGEVTWLYDRAGWTGASARPTSAARVQGRFDK